MTDEQKAALEARGFTVELAQAGEDWESYHVSREGVELYVRGDDAETIQSLVDIPDPEPVQE